LCGKNVRGGGARFDTLADLAVRLCACAAKAEKAMDTARQIKTLFIGTSKFPTYVVKGPAGEERSKF